MTDKNKGVLIYIFSIIAGLVFLFSKDSSRNIKMHAAQAITIFIGYFLLTIIYAIIPIYIPFFSNLIYIVYMAAIIFGIVKVVQEQEPEIPVISDIAKKIFGKQIEG